MYEDRQQTGLRNLVFAQSVLLVALAGLMIYLTWPRWAPGLDPNAAPRVVAARGDLAEDEKSTIALFKSASPSVVHITSLIEQQSRFSFNIQQMRQGTGTGFIWDDEGRIVTNYHVVHESDALEVVLSDGSKWEASVVGVYPDRDIAVIAISVPKVKKLNPLPIGSSSDLQVGQKVFAIGNPFGLDQSLTTGVISALGREIESMTRRPISGVIQTDAAINPGNSGGPLLDSAGRLIGMNTAIYSPSGVSSGVGFAIPVDAINDIVPQLIRHGKIARPGMGITPADEEIVARYRLPGLLILSIKPNSPAEKAGLRPTRQGRGGVILGDIITSVDKKKVKTFRDLTNVLASKKVGDVVSVEVLREGERIEVPVTLEPIE